MGSENNYDESAGIVPIDLERAEYHLRCMGTDCEWRAEEVAEFIKGQQAKIKALCEIAGAGHAKIMQFEEAVRVLAEVIIENRKQREYERINKLCPGGCVSARLEQAAVHVLNNPIAAEAVRKAGG